MSNVDVSVSICAFAVALSGCAVLLNGAHERVAFESTPPGATVRVDDATVRTPGSLVLRRGRVYEAVFELAGYAPVTREISRRWSTAVVGNVATLGAGLAVDFTLGWALGSLWEPYPPTLQVTLVPEGGARATAP